MILDKTIKTVDEYAKGKKGIKGYFKVTKNKYEYAFIQSP